MYRVCDIILCTRFYTIKGFAVGTSIHGPSSLPLRLDGYFCAVHAVADILRSGCLTYLVLEETVVKGAHA